MNIEDIPYNYAHCYATAEQCDKTEHYLRHHAARMNEDEKAKPNKIVMCITPPYILRVASGETCVYYRSDKLLHYAKGMKTLFDAVPKGKYNTIRAKVMNCFSCERIYYYALKGEQLISPAIQAKIESVFKKAEIPVPAFDEYELHPDWQE